MEGIADRARNVSVPIIKRILARPETAYAAPVAVVLAAIAKADQIKARVRWRAQRIEASITLG